METQPQNTNNMAWQGAVAQGVAEVGSGAINQIWAQKNMREQTKANMRLADHAFNQNKEMWNLQNEYNAPAQQMERLKLAGLNPNLMYGMGKSAGGNTSGPAPTRATTRQGLVKQSIQAPNMLGMYQDMRMNQANYDNTTQQTNLIEEKIQTEAVDRAWRGILLEREQWKWRGGTSWELGTNEFGERVRTGRTGHYSGDRFYYGREQAKARDISQYNVSLANEKNNLIKAQIEQAIAITKLRTKDLNWYGWKHGSQIGARAIGTIAGSALGLSKIGKPKIQIPKRSPGLGRYSASEIGPNYNF